MEGRPAAVKHRMILRFATGVYDIRKYPLHGFGACAKTLRHEAQVCPVCKVIVGHWTQKYPVQPATRHSILRLGAQDYFSQIVEASEQPNGHNLTEVLLKLISDLLFFYCTYSYSMCSSMRDKIL